MKNMLKYNTDNVFYPQSLDGIAFCINKCREYRGNYKLILTYDGYFDVPDRVNKIQVIWISRYSKVGYKIVSTYFVLQKEK